MKKSLIIGMLCFWGTHEVLAALPPMHSEKFRECARRAFEHAMQNMDVYRERAIRARDQELARCLRALPTEPCQVIREFLQEQLQEDDETAQVIKWTLKERERADKLVESADRAKSPWEKPALARFLCRAAEAMRARAHDGLDARDVDRQEALSDEDQTLVEFYELSRDCMSNQAELLKKFGKNLRLLKRRAEKAALSIAELKQQAQVTSDALSLLQEGAQERENRLVRLEVARQRERYLLSTVLIGVFGVLIWHVLMESVL